MKMKGVWNGMNWLLLNVQVHQHNKAKQQKTSEKTNSHAKEKRNSAQQKAMHDRASHHHGRGGPHGQTVVAADWPGPVACRMPRFRLHLCFD